MSLFNKHITNETIVVEGMKCLHCASKVKDALKANHVKADIDLETKMVKVSFDSRKIDLEKIKTIIEEQGFQCV